MRDLNHLYSDFMVETTLRERRAEATTRARIAEATVGKPNAWQRLRSVIRTLRASTQEPICEPAALARTEQGAAS